MYLPYLHRTKDQGRTKERPKNPKTQKVLFVKINHFSFAYIKNNLYLCNAKSSNWLCRHIIKAFIDALFLATLNLVNSNKFCQGNATIDVCVYIHIHALYRYAISIYSVASGLLVLQDMLTRAKSCGTSNFEARFFCI